MPMHPPIGEDPRSAPGETLWRDVDVAGRLGASVYDWLSAGGFGVVAAAEPFAILWADRGALARFGADNARALSARLLEGAEPGARRLRDLLAAPAGAAPRLERLRFRAGVQMDAMTFAVRRIDRDGRRLLLVAGAGARIAPPDVAASLAALAPNAAQEPPGLLAMMQAPPARFEAPPAKSDAPPANAPAPTVAAESRAARAKPAAAKPTRFVWETDDQDRFVSVGPELATALGLSGALAGKSLAEIAAEHGVDADGALAAAFARRATWSAVPTLWPVEGEPLAAPVDFFGAPMLDRARRFKGYRGFGVIRAERLPRELAAPAPVEAAPEVAASTPSLPNISAFATEIASEADAAPMRPDPNAQPPAHDTPRAQPPAPSRRADAARDHEALLAKVAAALGALGAVGLATRKAGDDAANAGKPEAEKTAEERTAKEAKENVGAGKPPADAAPSPPAPADGPDEAAVFARDLSGALAATRLTPEPDKRLALPVASRDEADAAPSRAGAEDEDDARPPRSESAAAPARRPVVSPDNVVPLRPAARPAAGRGEAMPDAGSVELTAAERQAFRDIARSLGARPEERAARRDVLRVDSVEDDAAGAREASAPREATPAPLVPAHPAPAPAVPAVASTALARNSAAMLDRLPVGVLVSRGEDLAYANRTLLDLLGFDDLAALQSAGGLGYMFHGREPGKLREAADGGAVPIVAQDGQVLPVDIRIQKLEWEGESASLFTVRRSLEGEAGAKVKTLELELRARQAEARELSAILDTATDGVAVLDEEGRILGLNRSAEALFGYDQNEVAGESFTILFTPPSQRLAADYLDGLRANGVASVLNDGREVTGRERQGGALPLFMTIGRITTTGPAKFCAVLRDMTHWKKAELQLLQARKDAERASALKSDFLAKISHEIRTPLNAILGFAEVIMEERFGPVGNDRYKDYLKDIHASGSHVMTLLNDLLDLSKIESGKLELTFAAVDMNRVVNECVSQMQGQALTERVILRVSLGHRLPQVVADERSLRQIVFNLLSNAIKFNEPGGQVIVSTALTDAGHAVIRVRDTGFGMSEEEIEIAMEPFRQIANARRRGGTGLGLPLTKALAEANRASFSIKSRKQEGTLVEVVFPPTRVLAG